MDTGTKVSDLLPIPADTSPFSEEKDVAQTIADEPTESHALAVADHEEKGAVQEAHEEDVLDLGWNAPQEEIANPLVGRLPNEELWLLIRRFDKQMYHLKEISTSVPGGLDVNIADEEEFSPDKLRSSLERLYMTVIIGFVNCFKHVARLRSWRETRRTAWFCTGYFLAWAFDLVVPLLLLALIALIVYPQCRSVLFPPAPVALVDGSTGGVQKPKAGVLGSHDSATGAPENYKGEAVEQEASNFVNGIASVAMSSAAGKHPQDDPEEGEEGDDDAAHNTVPDPTAVVTGAADAKARATGAAATPKRDKTKVPVETAMWTKMRPAMHGLASVSDGWERFANALSPTPPFPKNVFRMRLAAAIIPLFFASMFLTSYMLVKGVGFGVGFGFFGDPVIQRGLAILNTRYPKWQKLLELRNTLLKGVPTNAQLTITLLRIGEANKAPLPPPPSGDEPPPEEMAEVSDQHLRATGGDWPLNATSSELDEAMSHDPDVPQQTSGDDVAAAKDTKHGKKGSKILGLFKATAKGAVETAIGADKVKAKAGSTPAKNRLGAVPRRGETPISGPVDFKSRFHGRKGHVYLTTRDDLPYVAFSTDGSIGKIGSRAIKDLHPAWTVPVGEIAELKKVGGYGWKAKLVVGWALEREVSDGLEIVERNGTSWTVTAMPLRDELFNRLCTMGGQKWESW